MARRAGSTFSSSRRKASTASGRAGRRAGPKKSLGQHFLSDRNIITRIVDAAELQSGDEVLEIGAGPGSLTAELVERGVEVTAVEIDHALAEALRQKFAGAANLRVLEMDALEIEPASLFGAAGRYIALGNLPYSAGAAMVRRLLESEPAPVRLVVMLQKEVVESMLGRPGDMSVLGIGIQVYATGRRLFDVAPGAFFPPPKVRSSVIRLDRRTVPLVSADEREHFFRVVRAGFSAPRKQLRNALANGLGIEPAESARVIRAAGLEPSRRPQQLTIEEWLNLARSVGG